MYYNPTLNYDDLVSRLMELDLRLYRMSQLKCISNKPIEIVVAGSSSLILNHVAIPKTEDIDILEIYSAIDQIIKPSLLEEYNMNTAIKSVEHSLPYYCLDRCIDLNLKQIIPIWKLLKCLYLKIVYYVVIYHL